MSRDSLFTLKDSEILLPRFVMRESYDSTKARAWPVIAVDQFTDRSERSYWTSVENSVRDQFSTYHLVFPEQYLDVTNPENNRPRINRIVDNMRNYLGLNIFTSLRGWIYTQRTFHDESKVPRHGLVLPLDLEAYSFEPGLNPPIRPTEATIRDRIPPRLAIRERALLELPHILVLIDDAEDILFGRLKAMARTASPVYSVPLYQAGTVTGWHIPADSPEQNQILADLADLQTRFQASHPSSNPLVYAVGDGNHSLATAKAHWEQLKTNWAKQGLPFDENHPARYVLVEINNIRDDGILFEPIYRIINATSPEQMERFYELLRSSFTDLRMAPCSTAEEVVAGVDSTEYNGPGQRQRFGIGTPLADGQTAYFLVDFEPRHDFILRELQPVIDSFVQTLPNKGKDIEYPHEIHTVIHHRGIQIYVPRLPKSRLFEVVNSNVLPRKTFSMGEASEKRFYLESRRIVPK